MRRGFPRRLCSCNLFVLVRISEIATNFCFFSVDLLSISSPDSCSVTSTQHPKRAVAMQHQALAAAPAARLQYRSLHPAAPPAPKLQSTASVTYVGPWVLIPYFALARGHCQRACILCRLFPRRLSIIIYGVFVEPGTSLMHAAPLYRIRSISL